MIYYKDVRVHGSPLRVASMDQKLVFFGCIDHFDDAMRNDFPKRAIKASNRGFEFFEEELKAYETGTLKTFKTPVFFSGTPFQKTVYHELMKVPHGTVVSYSQLAKNIGDVKKTRAVANAVGSNRILILVPCHRIIAKDGSLGGFSSGLELKKALLKIEGVAYD